MKPNLRRSIATALLALPLVPCVAYASPDYPSPPIESDEFQIRVLNSYTNVWDDTDSGARRDVTILKPEPPSGYFILGYLAIPTDDAPEASKMPLTIAIKPKPGFESLIRKPDSFSWVYDDAGSGAARDVAIYQANCSNGYVALGAIAHPGGTDSPGDPAFVCVKRSMVLKASWDKKSIWDDAESGGDHGVALWRTSYSSAPPKNRLVLVSNAFWPTKDAKDPGPDEAWALSFKFDKLPNPAKPLANEQVKALVRPTASGPQRPSVPEQNLPPIEYQVPFFIVDDPQYDRIEQWVYSPTYTIVRTVNFEYVDEYDNTDCTVKGKESDEFEYSLQTGIEKETSWSVGLGLSVSATVGVEVEAAPLGAGATASASVTTELSSTFEHGNSETRSVSETRTRHHPVPKGTYTALFSRTSNYVVKRADGSTVEGSSNAYTDSDPVFVDWAPPGWDADDPCGSRDSAAASANTAQPATDTGSVFPISSETAFVRERKYPSPSGKHHLIFQEDGNLVVYTSSGGYVWGLDQTKADLTGIAQIKMQSDGNLAAYAADGGFVWSAVHTAQPNGTSLTLTADGKLQLVGPDGKVAWSVPN